MFVANPNKTPEIVEVLSRNKDKLLRYLGNFHTDKGVHRDEVACSCKNLAHDMLAEIEVLAPVVD